MPIEIQIKSLTNIGAKALEIHLNESKNINLKQKLVLKTIGFKQSLISKDPLILLITLKKGILAKNPSFLPAMLFEIDEALKNNGAVKNTDYEITSENK